MFRIIAGSFLALHAPAGALKFAGPACHRIAFPNFLLPSLHAAIHIDGPPRQGSINIDMLLLHH